MADASGKWSASLSRPAAKSTHWLRGLALLAILSPLGAAIFGGCVNDETEPPGPPIGSGGAGAGTSVGPGGSGGSGDCADGETQPCSYVLGEHNGVKDCFEGKQTCSGGVWGPCGGGQVSPRIAPPAHGSPDDGELHGFAVGLEPNVNKPLNLSAPVMCMNNPCDPRCKVFNDVPPGGYTIPGSPSPPWQAGGLTGITNSGLIAKGVKNPCYNAGDCQFGEYCNNPNTDPACSHDVCAQGQPLVDNCDANCASKICAANPTCCIPSGGPCAHDVCVTGARLLGCFDPCAIAVCFAKPACCFTTWDQSCVDLVPLHCPQTCPKWSGACVQAVHDLCGAICIPNGSCKHDKCVTGEPLAMGCDSCVDSICTTNPSCCTTAWDSTCVNAVTTCGVACPIKGQCKPWLPGQVDPACADVDLVGGIPCSGIVPICNVGTVAAPAGVPVEFFPAASGNIPQCAPGIGAPTACPATTQPIPPGQCISHTCPGVSGNEEIIVNPPGAGHVSECQCQNNWTVNTNGALCEPPNCNGPGASKRVKRPDMLVAIERSSNISASDFTQLQTALNAFFASSSMSLSVVGIELYPDSSPNCDTSNCGTPTNCYSKILYQNIGAGGLGTIQGAVTAAAAPAGNAPHSAALAGGYMNLAAYQATQPTLSTTPVMVFIMAGNPAFCNPSISALAGQAASYLVNKSIPTFVIGIGVSQANVDLIASAGGGKGYAITPGPNVQTTVAAALQDIRIHSYPCDFTLPGPGLFDPSSSSATYFQAPLPNVILTHANDLASCPGSGYAWYYDDNVVPTKMILCPATCSAVSLAIGTTVQYKLSCPQNYGTQTFQQDYTSDCPPDQKVQWGYLAYDTLALAGTSVDFSAQTGPSALMLSAAVPLATARAIPNTQKCLMAGPAPCPIDLFAALGGLPLAQNDVLRLTMKLNSNIAHTLTPTVNSWQLTYTCVDIQ